VILTGSDGEKVQEGEYEYTGNESQGTENVYIIATLQVREMAKPGASGEESDQIAGVKGGQAGAVNKRARE